MAYGPGVNNLICLGHILKFCQHIDILATPTYNQVTTSHSLRFLTPYM